MMFLLKSKNPGFLITGAGDTAEAVAALKADPEIRTVILDLNLDGEDALCAIPELRAVKPDVAVLVYTMYNDDIHVQNALLSGIQGFVTKEASVEELEKAILAVGMGNTYFNSMASKVLQSLLPQNGRSHKAVDEKAYLFDNYKSLSAKEREVFIHLAKGLDVADIARLLGKSAKTIMNQRTAVYDKLFIHDRHELIEKAKMLGLVL